MTKPGPILVWAALTGLAIVMACAIIATVANWIVTVAFPWLAAFPERQAIVVLGAAALIALAATEATR